MIGGIKTKKQKQNRAAQFGMTALDQRLFVTFKPCSGLNYSDLQPANSETTKLKSNKTISEELKLSNLLVAETNRISG